MFDFGEHTPDSFRSHVLLPKIRTMTFLENIKQDISYAVRMLRKNPAFAVTAPTHLGRGAWDPI